MNKTYVETKEALLNETHETIKQIKDIKNLEFKVELLTKLSKVVSENK